MDGKKPAKEIVTFTVELNPKWRHDINSVRFLLKALLRKYGLKCVRIDKEVDREPG